LVGQLGDPSADGGRRASEARERPPQRLTPRGEREVVQTDEARLSEIINGRVDVGRGEAGGLDGCVNGGDEDRAYFKRFSADSGIDRKQRTIQEASETLYNV
jgi:hypothetical protein